MSQRRAPFSFLVGPSTAHEFAKLSGAVLEKCFRVSLHCECLFIFSKEFDDFCH